MDVDSIQKVARLFTSGGSQAVRLPVEFRFEGKEVLIRHGSSGEVILTPVSGSSWTAFMALRTRLARELTAEGLENHLQDRHQPNDGPRDPFAGWAEPHKGGEVGS